MFSNSPFTFAQEASAYWVDTAQRTILFLDTLQKRSQNFCAESENEQPKVMQFETELILDGRTYDPPVNYKLERIIPQHDQQTDPSKRPIVIFDPRAAQGSGMAGMKKDGQIGQALESRHPTYYVSFFVHPEEGQTIELVCDTCIAFVRIVKDRHPNGPKPLLIGNCQAGWQLAMMHAASPDLDCLLMLAGAPLSYWAGSHDQNPIRFTSGMTGGTWAVELASDMGNGFFDSAHLIDNFEKNSPSETYWKKLYELYTDIDTGSQRYLDFERWWNSPVLFRREEIRFIVEQLFIGNKLAKGELEFSDGRRPDLRNIKTPIFILCSHHDVITPPGQALGWILDCYETDKEIVDQDQIIVYRMDDSAGHLGLIASSSVMQDTYKKLFSDDMLEQLPAGIYEAVAAPGKKNQFNYEHRSIEDIRKICPIDVNDEARFNSVKDVSEMLQTIYDDFAAPMMQAITTDETAEVVRSMHPVRARLTSMCDQNPAMSVIPVLAEWTRANRLPASKDTDLWKTQEALSNLIIEQMDVVNKQKDTTIDELFSLSYSMPWLKDLTKMMSGK